MGGIDIRAFFLHPHFQRTALAETANQLQVDPVPAGDGLAIHRQQLLPGLQAGLGGQALRRHGTDDRAYLLATEQGDDPEEQNRQ